MRKAATGIVVRRHFKRQCAMADGYSIKSFYGPAFCLSLEVGFAGEDARATDALAAL